MVDFYTTFLYRGVATVGLDYTSNSLSFIQQHPYYDPNVMMGIVKQEEAAQAKMFEHQVRYWIRFSIRCLSHRLAVSHCQYHSLVRFPKNQMILKCFKLPIHFYNVIRGNLR